MTNCGAKGGKKSQKRGGSILRQAALPALLTGLLLSTPKRRTRKPRRGKRSKTRRVRRA